MITLLPPQIPGILGVHMGRSPLRLAFFHQKQVTISGRVP